jgi:hypothetical protein
MSWSIGGEKVVKPVKIGLHDAEKDTMKHKTFPNYALMKIAAFHKLQGDTVEWWKPLLNSTYDTVYSSKVFDFTPENPYLPDNTVKGGTGYDITEKLPEEVDSMFPDYSIYPDCDYAIGYITRGCIRHCRWCVVPQKEGNIQPYRHWEEIARTDTSKLVLMDNNILACEHGINELDRLIGSGYWIDINQGMDARLVNERIAGIIASLRWIKYIRFSCDRKEQIEALKTTAKMLADKGVKPWRLFVYLLVGKDIEDAAYRVESLKQIGNITIYAQAERNEAQGVRPNKAQLEFAQRYVYGKLYRHETWNEYCEKRNLNFAEGIDNV